MAGSGLIARHAIIRGRVQGVGYRDWAVREAGRHGVAGWVRNRRDGTVEAVFAGPADAVAAMLAACRDGPASARVTEIEQDPWTDPLPDGFSRRPDRP